MKGKIGIVTVLYNSETVLEEFFKTLNNQTYKNFTLYVIDNQSPDGSLALSKKLASEYDFETVIIANDANYGVAKGNNIGIKKALEDKCDFVLLSNNDIALEKDTIELLLKGLETHNADMAVPKIYFYGTNKIWAAGGCFNKITGYTEQYGIGKEDQGQFQKTKFVTYAPTCFMIIKKQVFSTIGLMDENYFVYFDDTDFVYRAIKKNHKILYFPDSVIYHNESTSTGKMSDFSIRFLSRNLIYFSLKNYSILYAFYILSLNVLYTLFVLCFFGPRKKCLLKLKSFKEGWGLYFSSKRKKFHGK